MSTPSRESVDNRQRILSAAEELFSFQGFAATSVREIVQKAEVTAPVLYYYFGSKDELLTTLVSERFEQYLERMRPQTELATTVEGVLSTWCAILVEETVARPTTLRLILGAMWGPPVQHLQKAVFRFHYQILGVFTEALQRCDDSITEERARYALVFVNGMMNSLLFPILQLDVEVHKDELIQTIVPRVTHLIYDGEAIPLQTITALDERMMTALSEDSETSTPEKP